MRSGKRRRKWGKEPTNPRFRRAGTKRVLKALIIRSRCSVMVPATARLVGLSRRRVQFNWESLTRMRVTGVRTAPLLVRAFDVRVTRRLKEAFAVQHLIARRGIRYAFLSL